MLNDRGVLLEILFKENPVTEPVGTNFWVFRICWLLLSGYDIELVVISVDITETIRKLSGSDSQATRRWSRRLRPLQYCYKYNSMRREHQNNDFRRKQGPRDTASSWR